MMVNGGINKSYFYYPTQVMPTINENSKEEKSSDIKKNSVWGVGVGGRRGK